MATDDGCAALKMNGGKRYFIGVDGGGTRTRAVLIDEDGNVLGTGFAGSTNKNHFAHKVIRENLTAAVAEAASKQDIAESSLFVFLGLSAISTDADSAELVELAREVPLFAEHTQIRVENDSVAGLTGGLAGQPGIVLLAGTGSVCLGINAEGYRYMCGGWGALADDAGSGPWVGLQALHAAVRAEDGREQATVLKDIIFDRLGLTEPRQLIDRLHNRGLDRNELGELAPLVVNAYLSGDRVAARILENAVHELTSLARVTAERCFGASSCRLVLVGGLATSGDPFQTLLVDSLNRELPSIQVCDASLSPVQGSALEALRMGGVSWTDAIVNNLSKMDLSLSVH